MALAQLWLWLTVDFSLALDLESALALDQLWIRLSFSFNSVLASAQDGLLFSFGFGSAVLLVLNQI